VSRKIPLLLSFYGMSNGTSTLVFGQLTYTPINDLSFKDYNRRKTFRTLLRLYQTRPYSNQTITLKFDKGEVKTVTNSFGAFYEKNLPGIDQALLEKVILPDGQVARVVEGLYEMNVHHIFTDTIVVSDIDDTLVHSFINKKIRKFRTLMFTTMEKRRAVVNMQDLIGRFISEGGTPVYLSNSEQNLYPIIYRFLQHNRFPRGPLFLKQMRSLWQVIRNIKFPLRELHKTSILQDLIAHFPDKKFILMGDNTQHDLSIYLTAAEKFPNNVKQIVIRKVVERGGDTQLISQASEKLKASNIQVFYSDTFPAKGTMGF
jgi:phosphatidate phosphatase APP1